MSLSEIVNALPTLKRDERRELARRLFEVENEESNVLADSDHRADERFLILDAIETQDGKTESRCSLAC